MEGTKLCWHSISHPLYLWKTFFFADVVNCAVCFCVLMKSTYHYCLRKRMFVVAGINYEWLECEINLDCVKINRVHLWFISVQWMYLTALCVIFLFLFIYLVNKYFDNDIPLLWLFLWYFGQCLIFSYCMAEFPCPSTWYCLYGLENEKLN